MPAAGGVSHAGPGDHNSLAGSYEKVTGVRAGQTVLRLSGPWTPAVHSLLPHLHAVGFSGAPKPLGIDAVSTSGRTKMPGLGNAIFYTIHLLAVAPGGSVTGSARTNAAI
jgi:hypothetical protein